MISQEESVILTPSVAERRSFMKLPIAERRKILADQANEVIEHYQSKLDQDERQQWQGGDIVEY